MLKEKPLRIVDIKSPAVHRACHPIVRPLAGEPLLDFLAAMLWNYYLAGGKTGKLIQGFLPEVFSLELSGQEVRCRQIHKGQPDTCFLNAKAAQVVVILGLQQHFLNNRSGS